MNRFINQPSIHTVFAVLAFILFPNLNCHFPQAIILNGDGINDSRHIGMFPKLSVADLCIPYSALFGCSMQLHCRCFEFTLAQCGDDLQAGRNRIVDQLLFVLARAMQYEISHDLLQVQCAWMADAEP